MMRDRECVGSTVVYLTTDVIDVRTVFGAAETGSAPISEAIFSFAIKDVVESSSWI